MTHLRDRSTSPVFPHRCRRPTGTSAGNHTLSAADNCRFQATCQFRCVVALSHWRSPHNVSFLNQASGQRARAHTVRYDTSLHMNDLIAVAGASFTSLAKSVFGPVAYSMGFAICCQTFCYSCFDAPTVSRDNANRSV